MRGSSLPTATCNGQSANPASMYARNLSGRITYLRLRRGLQTLRHEGTQPLRKPPYRGFGRKRYEEVPCGLHFGYEHNYVLRAGWTLYWQVKGDVMIKGADVLRTGVALGIKLPIK